MRDDGRGIKNERHIYDLHDLMSKMWKGNLFKVFFNRRDKIFFKSLLGLPRLSKKDLLASLNKEDREIMGQFGLKTLRFFFLWRDCVNSGAYVKITYSEDQPVPLGHCKKKGYDVDFEYQCADCKDHREQRAHPMHEKTLIRKMRIAKGRQRAIQREAESLKAGYESKAIDEYGKENKTGSVRDNNGDSDKSKKTKNANTISA